MEKYIITRKTPEDNDITYYFVGWLWGAIYSTRKEDAKEMTAHDANRELSALRLNSSRYGKRYVKGIRMIPALIALLLMISSLCAAQDTIPAPRQDTIPVYIAVDDTTYRPDLWYPIEDAYGDTTITRWSNEYYHIEWGWQIVESYVDMNYQPFPAKFKVLNSQIREIDQYGNPIGSPPEPPAEIIVEDSVVTIISRASDREIYFMGEPIIKERRGK